jgi:hypothetical protein
MQLSVGFSPTPAFLAYAFTCLVLSLNLLTLWVYSGATRAKGGLAINPEDGARHSDPCPSWTRQPSRDSCARTATPRPQSIHSYCWDWFTF